MKRVLLFSLLFLAALAGGWTFYWHLGAEELETSFQVWLRERRAEGYRVDYESAAVTGFPARLTLTVANPVMTSPQGWRWEGPARIAGEAAVWSPLKIDIGYSGRHFLSRDDALPPRFTEIELRQAQMILNLDTGGWVSTGETRIEGVTATNQAGERVTIERIEGALGPYRPATAERLSQLDLRAELFGIVLPARLAEEAGYGERITRARLIGRLDGELPAAPPEVALPIWRDGGGVLQVRRIDFAWGPVALDGDGSLTLDPANRPLGAFSLEIKGLPRIIADMESGGAVPKDTAALLQLGVSAMAERTDAEGNPIVKLPVSFQEGRLFLGPFAIAPLPPLF